jgi:hypothetical protein
VTSDDPGDVYVCLSAVTPGGTTTDSWERVISVGEQSGAFSNTVSELEADTVYYYRCYATNAFGDAWADGPADFRTEADVLLTMSGDVKPGVDELDGLHWTGTGTTADPYLYTFVTTKGLNMAGYKVYGNNEDNRNVTLNMNGGPITGSQTAVAFDLKSTGNSGIYPADLTITNVGAVRIGKVWTYAGNGNPGAARGAGAVRIGADTAQGRAGKVEIAEILSSFAAAFSVFSAGAVTIDSSNDVLIWDGIATNGNISAQSTAGQASSLLTAGSITVRHAGSFRAADVLAYRQSAQVASAGRSGSILLNGDVLNGGASGSFMARKLDTHTDDTGAYDAGSVTVTGYTSVASRTACTRTAIAVGTTARTPDRSASTRPATSRSARAAADVQRQRRQQHRRGRDDLAVQQRRGHYGDGQRQLVLHGRQSLRRERDDDLQWRPGAAGDDEQPQRRDGCL